MPKKRQTPDRPRDLNQLAKRIVELSTGQAEDMIPPLTKTQERASKGGKARAAKLSRNKRVAIASKGGRAAAQKRR